MTAVVLRKAPGSPALDSRRVRALANRMLAHLSLMNAELSVLLSNDAFIAELNEKHRNVAKPTDVLAFQMDAAAPEHPESGPLLGDVVVSLDTAARQAKKRRRPLLEEVTHLLAHGLLHLIGYDHRTSTERRRMDALTKQLVDAATRTAQQR